jgi:type I restriction enzyme S subunit
MKRQRKSLGELCTIVKGTSPISKTLPGPYPLVTTGEAHKTADSFQFEDEAVCIPLISSTGHGHASLKRVHYQSGKFALANLLAAAFVKDSSVLSTKFLARYLMFSKDRLIVPLMTGATNMSISIDRLATVPIEFPPLTEQERIVKLLDEADELRKLRTLADRRSADLIPALFHEMFGDPATNEKDWPKGIIGSLVSEVRGGASLEPDDFVESGFPILHKGAIKPAGKIRIDDKKKTFAPFEFAAANGRSRVNRDYIAVTLRDLAPSGPSIGLAADLRHGPFDEYLLAQGAYGFVLDESRCCREYFVWLSNMPSFRYELKRNSVGSTQIHIRTPVYLKILIPLPNLPLQQEFALRASEIRELEAAQAASRHRVEHLFQSIQHRAFNQEL